MVRVGTASVGKLLKVSHSCAGTAPRWWRNPNCIAYLSRFRLILPRHLMTIVTPLLWVLLSPFSLNPLMVPYN